MIELISRLLRAERSIQRVRVSNPSTGDAGWDLLAAAGPGAAWVPEGDSVWETSTGTYTEHMADAHYARALGKAATHGLESASIVFVTARRWAGKRNWLEKRRKSGSWKDVRVYDAEDLAAWLAGTPRAAHWFAATQLHDPAAMADWVEPRIAWEPRALRLDAGPLSWLRWSARLTELIGRNKEREELLRWARDTDGGVRFRFLVGEGGAGKTRLAHEVADALVSDPGWAAGLVAADKPLPLDVGPKGCLLLVDYPEEKRDLVRTRLTELASSVQDGSRPVRVLFLTRHGPDYWEPLVNQAGAETRMDSPYILSEGIGPDDAYALFQSAVAKAPREPGAGEPQQVGRAAFQSWLASGPANHRPLLIAAAALQAVSETERSVLGFTGPQVIDALAKREKKRLDRLSIEHRFAEEALARLVAFAAVRNGLDADAIDRLVGAGLSLGLDPTADRIDALSRTGLFTAGGIAPPAPDIVGAALLVNVLGQRAQDAPDWLWAVIQGQEDTIFGRLARLSYDAEVVLGRHDHRLSHWLVRMVEGQPERCARVKAWSWDETWAQVLPQVAGAIAMTLAGCVEDEAEKAIHLNNGSNCLSAAGNGERALEAIHEAVKIRRRLAASSPERFEAALATGLNNLSIRLSEASDEAGALAACSEAVEIRRRLAADNPAEFEPDLAISLNNLSNSLAANGDRAGALAAIREAVELLRRLAAGNPAEFEPDLAGSLNNLSNQLADIGDGSEALAAIREAVELHRRLAAGSPARFEPDLAMSLNNLSSGLADVGDRAGALAAIREAVELYRRLASGSPVRFEPDLAMSLNNLSHRLADAGEGAGALSAIREAVKLYRGPAAYNPARFEPHLVRCLDVLADRLLDNGDQPAALRALEEAIRLIGPKAKAYPESEAGRRYRQMVKQRNELRGSDPSRLGRVLGVEEVLDLGFLLALGGWMPPDFLMKPTAKPLKRGLEQFQEENGPLPPSDVLERLRTLHGPVEPDPLWQAWTLETQIAPLRAVRAALFGDRAREADRALRSAEPGPALEQPRSWMPRP
ncbi:ATP-binding protein [Azospirillum brasilense]|uniref:ATP-binding protein n=1 Tax=Azospirillum brasilense TaxID=192 RepID=UPI000E69BC6D|nr:ATP-binding protein [Azospirillum brasilense]NUB27011.1 tetratricopeptide repeat protein [Azospirillum brasilense]NUB34783.1 tetratricopeptide repeat protein [Azospirillum brasilense]RIW01163.1 ATP-binding protein [Azospirillum brasilense]